jgi:hypothetical protein
MRFTDIRLSSALSDISSGASRLTRMRDPNTKESGPPLAQSRG